MTSAKLKFILHNFQEATRVAFRIKIDKRKKLNLFCKSPGCLHCGCRYSPFLSNSSLYVDVSGGGEPLHKAGEGDINQDLLYDVPCHRMG